MSIDDYNRGYQSGWSGIATGPPRSAAEMVGRWNAEADRNRMQSSGSSAPAGSGASGGEDYGPHALVATFGALGVGFYFESFIAAALGAIGGVMALKLAILLLGWIFEMTAWVFRPIPVLKVAALGATAAVGAQWVLVALTGPYVPLGPVAAAFHGALGFLVIAAIVRVLAAPLRFATRRR